MLQSEMRLNTIDCIWYVVLIDIESVENCEEPERNKSNAVANDSLCDHCNKTNIYRTEN